MYGLCHVCMCALVMYSLSCMAYVEKCSLYALNLLRVLIMNGCLIFSNVFSIYWNDRMVLFFHFINLMYYIDWFVCVEPFLHLWISLISSWWVILLMSCWIQFASILLRIFAPYTAGILAYSGFFFSPVVSFSYLDNAVLVKSLGVFPPLWFFGRVWEGLVLILL